jgi:hypothetical protein
MSNEQKKPLRKLRAKGRAVAGSHDFAAGPSGEQVGLRVQIVGGEHDGQSVPWYGSFSPNAEQRTVEQLQIAGWNGEDFATLPGLGSTEFDFQYEEYEGYTEQGEPYLYLKGQWINRMSVGLKNPLAGEQRTSFAERMQAKYGKGAPAGQRRPATNGTQRRQGGAPSGDDWQPPTDEDLGL